MNWNPLKVLESLCDLLGQGQSYDKIYDTMRKTIEVVDQYDDTIIAGIKFMQNSKLVTIPENINYWINIILTTEKDSIAQFKLLLELMDEAENDPVTNTPFEKVNAVVTKATEIYQEQHPEATVSDIQKKVIDTGNKVNTIYNIAKGFFK